MTLLLLLAGVIGVGVIIRQVRRRQIQRQGESPVSARWLQQNVYDKRRDPS